MSQAGIVSDSSSPSSDIEKITGDVGGAVGPDAAFNLNLLTGDGLTTTGNPGANTITISVDGLTLGTGQTIGAVTADLITIALGATPTTYIIEAKIAGFEATTPAGVAYNLICGVRTTGAAATIIGIQDKYTAEEAALTLCAAAFVAVGNTAVVRVTGTAGLTIRWKASTVQLGV
jgi:hypothetical protein